MEIWQFIFLILIPRTKIGIPLRLRARQPVASVPASELRGRAIRY
uniref:Uncharacterized protein n=1 Tax=Arundo donax TaxID=35708 RepID=A0A0A9A001_ARUDO